MHSGSKKCARQIIVNHDYSMQVVCILSHLRLVQYCIDRLEKLIQFQIVPFVVFDGSDLPIKQDTNSKRREYVKKHTKIVERVKRIYTLQDSLNNKGN